MASRLAKAVDIGQAIARDLFCAMTDPAMRGSKFRWSMLPRMAGTKAKTSLGMHLPSADDREREFADAAASNEAHRLLNERKKKVLSDTQIARALEINGHLPLYAARITALETAIRKHRDAQGHNLCWENDEDLYKVLGEPVSDDQRLPAREEFLGRCAEYWELRRGVEDTRLGIKPLEKTIGDTHYELSRELLQGADAYHDGVDFRTNPHHEDSQGHFDWESGYELAEAGDEFPAEGLTSEEIKAGWAALKGRRLPVADAQKSSSRKAVAMVKRKR